jgi:hypothetical protein
MVPGEQRRVSPQALHLFAGLETGVVGGAAMLAWLMLAALLDGRSPWVAPSLLGSLLYRESPRAAFTVSTLAGLALQFFASGVVGVVFGVLVGDLRNRLRVALLGVLAALVWYYGSQALIWKKLGFLATLYVSPRSLVMAHVLYGLVLGLYPGALQSLRRQALSEGLERQAAAPGAPAGPIE